VRVQGGEQGAVLKELKCSDGIPYSVCIRQQAFTFYLGKQGQRGFGHQAFRHRATGNRYLNLHMGVWRRGSTSWGLSGCDCAVGAGAGVHDQRGGFKYNKKTGGGSITKSCLKYDKKTGAVEVCRHLFYHCVRAVLRDEEGQEGLMCKRALHY